METSACECRWAEGEIKLDGVADESDWKNAQVIDNFRLPWLQKNARSARTKTSAKLLWDREYLYFFAEMQDTDLYSAVTEQDGAAWNDDVFELFFKPAADKPGYYEFEVNAANTVLDMFLPRRNAGGYNRFKSDRKFEWKTAVKLSGSLNKWQDKDEGWSVEGRIPWRDFLPTGGRPAPDEVWTFALCRSDVSVDNEGVELSTSAPLKSLPHADFHHYEDYAPLKFVGPPKSSPAKPYGIMERTPWTGSAVLGSPDPPAPFAVKRAFEHLKIPCPMHVYHEPGTNNLLLLHQRTAWGGAGRILRIKDDPNVSEFQTLYEPDRICYGVAFHPRYAENGHIFIGSNGPLGSAKKMTRISRFTVSRSPPYQLDPQSEAVILEWESDGHNGGDLVFGADGMMYVTSGDGSSDSDTHRSGQDLTRLLAKVLRIDVDHPAPGKPYSVPADNPFIKESGARPETWAYGLRNPWRLAVDRESGELWVGNNGQDLWEQVYLVRKGDNYGWSVLEGSHPFYPNRERGIHPFAAPVAEHPHSEARSLTGGQVYYGSQIPELRGMYIYGDWSTGKIWGLKHDGARVVQHLELADTTLQITGFGFDSHGELLIADHGGGYYQLIRSPKREQRDPFPERLSETGLFASVRGHKLLAALIPYDVNAPLWSDGAHKQRYLALPGGDAKIGYTTDRSWDFPNGTALVKSFALDLAQGARRWIETRLLVKTDGEWAGYSYQWNDEQTEAVLVAKAGADREFTVRDAAAPGGARKQSWHYPSRTECTVCHTRAANFILGLNEAQLNRDYDYGGVVDNQLRALEHLGVLRVNWKDHEHRRMSRALKAQGKPDAEANKIMDEFFSTRMQREPVVSSMLPRTPALCSRLADPYDKKQPLADRARSYLHSNCAQCHMLAGGGNAAMELEYTALPDAMNVVNVRPNHHTFELPDARLVAPGKPERSVLLHRIGSRGPGQMPPLATSVVDSAALELIRDWIVGLPDSGQGK